MSVKDRVAQVAQHVIVAGLKLKQKLGAMVRLVCLISSNGCRMTCHPQINRDQQALGGLRAEERALTFNIGSYFWLLDEVGLLP